MITINNKVDCTGCYACVNICPQTCISMTSDGEGFWYPEVDYSSCVKCGLCIKVCPIIHKNSIQNEPKAFACINKNQSVRMESSSGGMFTLFAEQILSNNGVVFGAIFDESFSLSHSFIETREEIFKLRGSKYVQSKIGNTYKQAASFLKKGKNVLYSGTPCQIAGLKAYLGQPYDNLLCIDIICHGVPSPKVLQKYILFREKIARASTHSISFRMKSEGWKKFSVSFLFDNGKEYRKTLNKDLYMRAFLDNVCLRPSCYNCAFKTLHRESDITLADFWGIEKILPEMDDDMGTSLIFANSINGRSFLKKIENNMRCIEVDIDMAVLYNTSATKSVRSNIKRESFYNELEKIPFDQLVKKYCSESISKKMQKKVKTILLKVLRNN